MITPTQHKINSAYNLFLSKLILWYGLYNRVKADTEQGYEPIKNYEKMLSLQATVSSLLPNMEHLKRTDITSYYPLVDDVELIKIFKDVTV